MTSSMLFPKTQRYNILPMRCIQLPCRNMLVSTVENGGDRHGFRRESRLTEQHSRNRSVLIDEDFSAARRREL